MGYVSWAPDNKTSFVKSLLCIDSLMYTGNGSLNYESIQSGLVHTDKTHYSSSTVIMCPRPAEIKKLGLFGRCFLLFCQLSQQ